MDGFFEIQEKTNNQFDYEGYVDYLISLSK
jgi:hypothetical protein